jgi:SRSO17 transposase
MSPDGMQRLLNFYAWDADRVRDALARYVVSRLGDPAAVLVAENRRYTGTAGRVENCQVGVFLAYAAPGGARALIDRELYLPEKWTDDRDRCAGAGIGDDTGFATKPALAQKMIERAAGAGVPFGWFAADEVYGQNTGLRDWQENQTGTSSCRCWRTRS